MISREDAIRTVEHYARLRTTFEALRELDRYPFLMPALAEARAALARGDRTAALEQLRVARSEPSP